VAALLESVLNQVLQAQATEQLAIPSMMRMKVTELSFYSSMSKKKIFLSKNRFNCHKTILSNNI
jgi:hypothetical protein